MCLNITIVYLVLLIGTESETKAFMAVCIETAKRYNLDDYRTPVFIFERLCSIIYPVSYLYPCQFQLEIFHRIMLKKSLAVNLSLAEVFVSSSAFLGGE